MLLLGCLSSKPTSGGLYIHDSEHPHVCTNVIVDAVLVSGGDWISGRRRDMQVDRHEHDKSRYEWALGAYFQQAPCYHKMNTDQKTKYTT